MNLSFIKDGILIRHYFGRTSCPCSTSPCKCQSSLSLVRFPSLGQPNCTYFDSLILSDLRNEYNPHYSSIFDVQNELVSLRNSSGSQNTPISSSDSSLDYGVLQAESFITLLLLIHESRPASFEVAYPLINALSLLPDQVWSKYTISNRTLSMLVELLDKHLSNLTCSTAVCSIITKILNTDGPNYAQTVVAKIFEIWEYQSHLSDLEWQMLHLSLESLPYTKTIKRFNSMVHDTYILKHGPKSNDVDQSESWMAKLSLNDEIEVKIGSTWISGVIVRINLLLKNISIEYRLSASSPLEMITVTRDNASIRSARNQGIYDGDKASNSERNMNFNLNTAYLQTSYSIFSEDIVSFLLRKPTYLTSTTSHAVGTCRMNHTLKYIESNQSLCNEDAWRCHICNTLLAKGCSHFACVDCDQRVCCCCQFDLLQVIPIDQKQYYTGKLSNDNDKCSLSMITNVMMIEISVSDSVIHNYDGQYTFAYWRWENEVNEKYPVYQKVTDPTNTSEEIILMTCIKPTPFEGRYRWVLGTMPYHRVIGSISAIQERFYSFSGSFSQPEETNWTMTDSSLVIIQNALNTTISRQNSTKTFVIAIINAQRKLQEFIVNSWSHNADSLRIIETFNALRLELVVATSLHIRSVSRAIASLRPL